MHKSQRPIQTYANAKTLTQAHTNAYRCTHTHTHTHVPCLDRHCRRHTHTRTHTHTHTHTQIHRHTHTHTQRALCLDRDRRWHMQNHTHTHTHTHKHPHAYRVPIDTVDGQERGLVTLDQQLPPCMGHTSVTGVLQGCSRSVTGMLHKCCNIIRVFQGCHRSVSGVLQECSRSGTVDGQELLIATLHQELAMVLQITIIPRKGCGVKSNGCGVTSNGDSVQDLDNSAQ
jgi:hypothetical protein